MRPVFHGEQGNILIPDNTPVATTEDELAPCESPPGKNPLAFGTSVVDNYIPPHRQLHSLWLISNILRPSFEYGTPIQAGKPIGPSSYREPWKIREIL
jgi:hypothetical protein